MLPADKAKLIAFYEAGLARFGPGDPRSLHWISQETQRIRFQVLYGLRPWEGVSVADIGCGLGDFCGYLQEQGHLVTPLEVPSSKAVTAASAKGHGAQPAEGGHAGGVVRYAGYDISPQMIAAASLKYPQGHFQVRDILESGLETPCDYVVASGTLNIRVADHERFFQAMVTAMYRGCLRGVAFNFLGPPRPDPWSDSRYYSADPDATLAFCRTLSPQVFLMEGYLHDDYTVYMHK